MLSLITVKNSKPDTKNGFENKISVKKILLALVSEFGSGSGSESRLDPDSIGSPDPDPDWESGSGSRGKRSNKNTCQTRAF